MNKNLFWPIYNKLEEEFKELSYYIAIDKKQLKTYSIKIADLILRTVAECENIAILICKSEYIKFRDKRGHIRKNVYFDEYIEALNNIFKLNQKLIRTTYINIDENAFDMKLQPFKKAKLKVNGKEKQIIPWYNAYNKIKHDRVRYFRLANLENLINALAALFMLNVYFKNEVFYEEQDYDYNKLINKIGAFSNVFEVDYSVKSDKHDYMKNKNTFFDPVSFFEISLPMSVYVLETDKEIKTDRDRISDSMDKLESKVMVMQSDGSLEKRYTEYSFKDHKTFCRVVASINRY